MFSFASRRLRIVASAAVTALVASLSVGIAGAATAAPAVASPSPTVVYDSIPATLAGNYPSQPFQAQQVAEFGDLVTLGGADRAVTKVTVTLVDWACGNDYTDSDPGAGVTWVVNPVADHACTTTPGTGFIHPITLNLWDVDNSGALPVVADQIASVTKQVTVPFRPSQNTTACPGTHKWNDPDLGCVNGKAFTVTFDLPATRVVGDSVGVSIAYNTQTYGAAPIGAEGPYNSLNVAVQSPATVGTDENVDEMFINSVTPSVYSDGGAGGTGTLRADTGWSTYAGLAMEIEADNDLLTPPATVVKVLQKDVKPVEDATTYESWHEGKNNPTPRYAVHENGLTLGDGSASTIIKGTNVPSSTVTESQLRALLATASVDVEGGSVTFQVPIHFGTALTGPGSNFTTLRSTSLAPGTYEPSLSDVWATTRAFGSYTAQEEAPLEELLNAVFAQSATVWLAGFGVQADTTARVSQFAWGSSIYKFQQPEIQECDPVTDVTVTNVTDGDWDFSQSGAHGSHTYTAAALNLKTTTADSAGKSAGYLAVDFPLSDAGELALGVSNNLTPGPGDPVYLPGLNLGIDLDGNGSREGYLVYEPSVYGGNVWASGSLASHHTADWPTVGGGGGTYNGTLNQWLVAIPTAKVVEVGYSLGSGVIGDVDLHYFTIGCTKYTFDYAVEATTVTATPSAATQVFGTATPETVAVTVKTVSNIKGIGTVVLKDGSTTIAGPATLNSSGQATLTVPASLAIGGHSLKVAFTATTGLGQSNANSATSTFTVLEAGPDVTRIAGADRYKTAVEISHNYAPGVSRVYIAVGTNYADALSAAPVAAKFNAPLLLVKPGSIPADIATELNRLHPAKIIIVGGEGAVSKKVETALAALAFHPDVTRIAGDDRYETSRLVAKSGFPTANTAYLSSGANFPDALAAGPAAAHFNGPVILVKGGSFQLERATRLLLEQMGVDDIRIAGGTAVVSAGIESQLTGLHYGVTRQFGAGRYETAIAINAEEFTTADEVYIATGEGFADALTGAALAGLHDAPLFLSSASCIRADVKDAIMALDPDDVFLLGGTGVLSANVEDLVTCP